MNSSQPTPSALVVVDVQNSVMQESAHGAETVEVIAHVVDRARTAGVPVVWVRHSAPGNLEQHTEGWQIVDRFVPGDGEPIVDKTFGDAFAETDLQQRLDELGATSFALVGAQTDGCIRSTFYGGLYRGYDVTVVADGHTTADLRPYGSPVSPEQSIALFTLQARFTVLPGASGSATTSEEIFAGA